MTAADINPERLTQTPLAAGHTQVLLSFSSAYAKLAKQLAQALHTANIGVRYDQWEGGGGVVATPSGKHTLDGVEFLVPLLTPSAAANTWISEAWKQKIYDEARTQGIDVLTVRGEICEIPDYLSKLSFADLCNRDYERELQRLVKSIRDRTGNSAIVLPTTHSAQENSRPAETTPLTVQIGEALANRLEVENNIDDDTDNNKDGIPQCLDENIAMMRDGLFYELGVQFPALQLRTNPNLSPWSVQIAIYDIPETQRELHPDSVMVNQTVNALEQQGFKAVPTTNPASGMACAWIPTDQAEQAMALGLTTWDAQSFLILLLSSVLRRKAADFIGMDEAQVMLNLIQPVFPQLVAQSVPKPVPLFVLTDVLKRLVIEGVSIRNLRRILMTLADWGRMEKEPMLLTEYVRAALKRQITHRLSRGTRQLVVFLLHPDLEGLIRTSIKHTATGSYVDLAPEQVRSVLRVIEEAWSTLPEGVQRPQILTTLEIRASVRRLVAPSMYDLHVVSYQELEPTVTIQPIGRISLDGFSPRPGVSVIA